MRQGNGRGFPNYFSSVPRLDGPVHQDGRGFWVDNTPEGEAQEMSNIRVLEQENARLRAKMAKQRTEVARLTQKLEAVTADKMALLKDIKWMRGERE
jgi:hypothetical protein